MAIKNNLTNSSLRKFLPSRVISGFAQSMVSLEGWMYDDGTGDPWWQGAIGSPVKWIMTADVFASNHSSHLTRMPNLYTALDIVPGMWVFSNAEPRAVRITSIISKTDSSIECVVEDVDRYNTFADPTGSGTGVFAPSSDIIFFELGDDGLPVLNPLPPNTDISNVSQIEARFRVFNPTVENRFFQLNHGFKEGQVVKIDSSTGKFVQATSNDIYMIGTVVAVGPGPHYFYLSPTTKIIKDLVPGLPGVAGDIIWIDPVTGDRATAPNGSSAALYIKMTNEIPCFTLGALDDPLTWDGTIIKINNELVTFTSGGGPIDLTGIIDTINGKTENHGVVASAGAPANKVVGSVSYPTATPGDISNYSFRLNGIELLVAQPSINFADSGMIGWWDIIRAINELTHVHNVYATFDTNSGCVVLENAMGGDIIFEPVSPLVTTDEDKTVTDMIGVPEGNPAAATNRLLLTRPDGGSIIITDVAGSFAYDTGIHSADNGVPPIAMVVDKTMMSNENYVVADIAARDALTGLRTGDQVFVQTAEDSEWALFVWVSDSWTKISDYDSSTTDANSMKANIDYASPEEILIGTMSGGSRIVNIVVRVTEEFDGVNPTITFGTYLDSTLISPDINYDLTVVGTYETGSSYTYEGVVEGEVVAYLDAGGSTQGSAQIIVSYM